MNDNISYLKAEYEHQAQAILEADKDEKKGGGSPPGGGDLEARVSALEKSLPEIRDKLTLILAKVESIDKHSATKADLVNTELSILKWCIGTALALTGLAVAVTFGLTKLLGSS